MAELDPAFHALARLHRALVDPEDLKVTLDRIVALSINAIPGCDEASVTAATTRPATVAQHGPDVEAIDTAQYETSGPCLSAYETRTAVAIPDIDADVRWPKFRAAALEHGVRSSLSHPLLLHGRALGSINLYGRVVNGFDDRSDRMATLFAEQAAIALANAINAKELQELADQLRDGLRNRDVIGQAKGILMAQRRITADAAFEVLRAASQQQNRKLRQVAEDLAATGQLEDQ